MITLIDRLASRFLKVRDVHEITSGPFISNKKGFRGARLARRENFRLGGHTSSFRNDARLDASEAKAGSYFVHVPKP